MKCSRVTVLSVHKYKGYGVLIFPEIEFFAFLFPWSRKKMTWEDNIHFLTVEMHGHKFQCSENCVNSFKTSNKIENYTLFLLSIQCGSFAFDSTPSMFHVYLYLTHRSHMVWSFNAENWSEFSFSFFSVQNDDKNRKYPFSLPRVAADDS